MMQRCKQMWFSFLMVFIIGWSSASIAALQNMHLTLPQQSNDRVLLHSLSVSDVHMPCAEKNPDFLDSQQSILSCHTVVLTQQMACQDCDMFACQASVLGLSVDTLDATLQTNYFYSLHSDTAYQAQHLTGFWQKILRPPKNLT